MERQMPAGTVRFFNTEKGFGFIAPDDGGDDIFVHISEVEKAGLSTLSTGDFLEFDVERSTRSGKFVATKLDRLTP